MWMSANSFDGTTLLFVCDYRLSVHPLTSGFYQVSTLYKLSSPLNTPSNTVLVLVTYVCAYLIAYTATREDADVNESGSIC